MGRSSDEKGADKANAVRKSQQRDRQALAKDIEANQKLVASLNDEAAPIRAEVRKVEAEVGPIKYIAAFIYGTTPDETMLEKAVTWIIILIVIVFDPLAVIMLLAAQMTFGWKKEQSDEGKLIQDSDGTIVGIVPPTIQELDSDVGEKPTEEEKVQSEIEYQFVDEFHEPDHVTPATALGGDITAPEELTADSTELTSELDKWNRMIEEAEREAAKDGETTVEERVAKGETYIDNEGKEVHLDVDLPVDESKKKTYMIKNENGTILTKTKE
jgi:hypothetical protein